MPMIDLEHAAALRAGLVRALPLALLAVTSCAPLGATTPVSTSFDEPTDGFEVSDGWVNGDIYGCGWRRDNARFEEGSLVLALDDERSRGRSFSCGEYRSREHYGYGYYEVRMRAARGDGLLSAFFTYTGDPFSDPHDEIDFEFLGRNTRQVQVNYFVDGKGHHEKMVDLGFDAADGFHTYGFDWQPDAIRWYIDCKQVREVTAAEGPLPSAPGRIFVHLWNGQGVDDWLGRFDYEGEPIEAAFDQMSFMPGAGHAPDPAACDSEVASADATR
jgi:endo-1,3-1,4-beta-glycanase ExoK